jgi:hypothetical protein
MQPAACSRTAAGDNSRWLQPMVTSPNESQPRSDERILEATSSLIPLPSLKTVVNSPDSFAAVRLRESLADDRGLKPTATIFRRAAAEEPWQGLQTSATFLSNTGKASLATLRQLLADKYPEAERKAQGHVVTGIESLDAVEGGLRCGAVTELTSTPANGALFIDGLLTRTCENQSFAALVDAGGMFDPDSSTKTGLARLLWVRCKEASLAVKAADLLLRDGNLPLLLMDLQALTPKELGKVPASTWHRFQRLVEQTSLVFVILTRQRTVESAQVRITLSNRWTLQAQRRSRAELTAGLNARVTLRRSAGPGLETLTPVFRTA